jgi:Uma2 family endonuclease
MSVPAALRLTYRDYLLLPEDRRYEVIEGELYMTPAPTPYHQLVKGRIKRVLDNFVETHGLGTVLDAPCDVVLSETDVVQPDILFVSSERRAIIGEKFIAGAPDLMVEVLSPSTEERDRTLKAKLYAKAGVRELWLADPESRTIEILVSSAEGFRRHDFGGAGRIVASALLSGLELAVDQTF